MFATTAYAQTATGPAPAGGGGIMDAIGPVLPMIIGFAALFYFMVHLPQQRRAKARQAMLDAIKRGDTVVMSSGLIGKVVRVEDAELQVELAAGVVVKVVKAMIGEVRGAGAPAPANDAASPAPAARSKPRPAAKPKG